MFVQHLDSAYRTRISCPGFHDSPTGPWEDWPQPWMGWFEVPSWSAVTAGQRPPIMEVDREPGVPRQGWQHAAAIRIESSFRTEILMSRMSPVEQPLLRSQSGPCAGGSILCLSQLSTHASRLSFIPGASPAPPPSPSSFVPAHLRVWPAARSFWPPPPRRMFEDWALGRRSCPLESAAARVCREAWGRVVTNMFVRDMDWGGACGWRQQALGSGRRRPAVARRSAVGSGHNTRLLCSWQWRTKTRSSNHGQCGLTQARRRKEKTYRELTGPGPRGRLVVLALEVGGRWSAEAKSFVGQLAKARARSEPRVLQRRMEQACEVVLHPLVCRGSLVCHVSPWCEGDNWC